MEPPFEPGEDHDDDSVEVFRWKIYLILGFFIMLAMGFSLVMAMNNLSEAAGQFGDSFGWMTAIFSSLASAGAVYAVFLQTKEMRDARVASQQDLKDRQNLAGLQSCLILIEDYRSRREIIDREYNEIEGRLRELSKSKAESLARDGQELDVSDLWESLMHKKSQNRIRHKKIEDNLKAARKYVRHNFKRIAADAGIDLPEDLDE